MTPNGVDSNHQGINCGVPQGSTLGPLLVLIYVNDMPLCCSVVKPILFADDTTLLACGNDLNELALKGTSRCGLTGAETGLPLYSPYGFRLGYHPSEAWLVEQKALTPQLYEAIMVKCLA